jgi:hypothetical protein
MSVFLLKTHLLAMGFTPSSGTTRFQTVLSYIDCNSDLMASSHLSESGSIHCFRLGQRIFSVKTLRLHAVPCTSQVHGLSLLAYVALVLLAVELEPQHYAGLVLFQLTLKYMSSGLEPLPHLFVDLVLPNAHQPKNQVVGLSDQYQILFCVMLNFFKYYITPTTSFCEKLILQKYTMTSNN